MKRTVVAVSFFIVSALIGGATAVILLRADFGATATERAPEVAESAQTMPEVTDVIAVDPDPPSFVVTDHRVAVRFPARYEFERMINGEVRFWDPDTKTRIAFHVSRLADVSDFQENLDGLIRKQAFRGQVGEPVYVSETHVHLTAIRVFRIYSKISIFVGEDCWGEPLLVQALYQYDRTSSGENYWLDQTHGDFPQFEFAYRCPTGD